MIRDASPDDARAEPGAEPAAGAVAAGPAHGQSTLPSFEEATRRLGQIVAQLEGGDLPLERSLALFEEGVRLARSAEERLDRAERRVEELLGFDAQGKPKVRELGGGS